MSGKVKQFSDTIQISILLPIHNEEDNLVILIQEIVEALAPLNQSFEIIMVDDRSTDRSTSVIEELCRKYPNIRGIFFRANRGQTAAFDAGFREASGTIIVTMDADRQNDPKDIPRMLSMINDEGYDFVTGWRRNRQDGFVLRKIPSKIANWIIRRVTGTKLKDMGCSLKVYRREITNELRLYGEMHRFISVLVESTGAKVGEIEVNHRARAAGISKYGINRTFKVILDLITIWFLRSFETKPIYVFGGIGGGLISLSALLSGVVLWEKFAGGVWVHRNPLFMVAAVCVMVGVQFIALGLLAELVIRTYFESQDRRPYSVRKRVGFPETQPNLSRDKSCVV